MKPLCILPLLLGLNPLIARARACAAQGLVEKRFEQAVSGYHALALREMLGLDAACGGRRVTSVFALASARDGASGGIRLILNNAFVGESRTVTGEASQRYEFMINPSNNALDIDLRTIELQVEGDLLVTGVGVTLENEPAGANSGVLAHEVLTFLGASHHAHPGVSATTLDLSPRDGRFHALLLKATDGDYRVERVSVRLGGGGTRDYPGFALKEGEARRIDLEGAGTDGYLRSISILGGSAGAGQIELSGIGEGRGDAP